MGHRENMRAKKSDRQRLGLCVQCGKDNDRKHLKSKNGRPARYCSACLEMYKEHEKRSRERAAASVDAIRRALGGRS